MLCGIQLLQLMILMFSSGTSRILSRHTRSNIASYIATGLLNIVQQLIYPVCMYSLVHSLRDFWVDQTKVIYSLSSPPAGMEF